MWMTTSMFSREHKIYMLVVIKAVCNFNLPALFTNYNSNLVCTRLNLVIECCTQHLLWIQSSKGRRLSA